jgi:hypothetical protein
MPPRARARALLRSQDLGRARADQRVAVVNVVARVERREREPELAALEAQVALIRLDHSGKDETKGQRGGSAKSGDVDAVWRMSTVVEDRVYRLDCEAARLPITEKALVIHRHTTPNLGHRVDAAGVMAVRKAEVEGIIELLDANGMPDDATNEDVREFLRLRGKGKSNDKIADAVKVRKGRVPAWKS